MIILEADKEKTLKRRIPIPQKMEQRLQALRKLYEPYIDTTEGGKVLKQNTDEKVYNNKSDDTKNGENRSSHDIPVSVAKERLKMQRKQPTNSLEYLLYGGSEMERLLDKGIKQARARNTVVQVPQVSKVDKGQTKITTKDTKPIEVNGGSVTIVNV